MIFVDSNIPMYLVGASHPNKDTARRFLVTWVEQSGGYTVAAPSRMYASSTSFEKQAKATCSTSPRSIAARASRTAIAVADCNG